MLAVTPEPAATGKSMVRRTIGPASSGVGRVWPAGISLSHHSLATSVSGWAQCTLTRSNQIKSQVYGVSSDTLVRLASGLDVRCVKKQCG